MASETDSTRRSEVTRLSRFLSDDTPGVHIFGVNGVGGVGKTYLVDHVLAGFDLSRRGLKLWLDGAHRERVDDFMDLIDGRLATRTLPPPANPGWDYFPNVRKVAEHYRALCEQAQRELEGAPGVRDAIKDAAKKLLRLGIAFNPSLPESAREDADGLVEAAESVLRHLNSLRGTSFLYRLRAVTGLALRDQVKRDLYGVTAQVLVTDLAAALGGLDGWNRFRFLTQRPIAGLSRMVLVIDDFEALAPTLSTFLIAHLVPRLAESRFSTSLIIVGRDSLEATDTHWGRFAGKHIRDEIRLNPFNRDESLQLLATAGVEGQRAQEVFERTQGLPSSSTWSSKKHRRRRATRSFSYRNSLTGRRHGWLRGSASGS